MTETTFTIIGAWDAKGLQNLRQTSDVDHGTLAGLAAENAALRLLASFVSNWLEAFNAAAPGQALGGFTIASTYGGGGGWPTEPGFTVTLAGCRPDHRRAVEGLAGAIRAHERQEAVCVLERAESFCLVEAGDDGRDAPNPELKND